MFFPDAREHLNPYYKVLGNLKISLFTHKRKNFTHKLKNDESK